jgi:hypothetical protein
MHNAAFTQGGWFMSERSTVPCRVDFRVLPADSFKEHTGRLESLWATGCTILTSYHPASDAKLELRLYLPDGEWPLRVEDAHINWAHWDSLTVEFTLPARDQERVRQYLAPDHALEHV